MAAMILGIVGGTLGLAVGFFDLNHETNSIYGGPLSVMGAFLGFVVFIGGIVGGAFCRNYLNLAFKLMLVSGIVGGVLTLPGGVLPGVVLVIGAVLAYLAQTETANQQNPA